jgi:hypothetical protein
MRNLDYADRDGLLSLIDELRERVTDGERECYLLAGQASTLVDAVAVLGAERDALRGLLQKSHAHVYRQQGHGKHEQDRADAADLLPEIDALINPTRPT